MGLFDLFGNACTCPLCRRKGAKQFRGKVKCAHSDCPNFDQEYASSATAQAGLSQGAPADLPRFSGSFDPGESRVEIRYRNFRGEERTYIGDERTLQDAKGHISIRLAPTGKRAAFAKKWVQNLSELRVPLALPQDVPSGRERRVLNFHKRKGSTSALYEKLRQKYPNFE